jgi:membrane protein YdbS with pleckstrin-like domain
MEKREFRPTKMLLMFWLLGVFTVCILLGGAEIALCVAAGISGTKPFVAGFLLLLIVFSTSSVLFFSSIRYELDDRYITKSSGILWKQRRMTPLDKITNIDVRQGPFERLFGYGQIWIFTPSTGSLTPEMLLIGVLTPHEMKGIIVERTEAARHPYSAPAAPTLQQSAEVIPLLQEIRNSLKNIELALAHQNDKQA